MESKITKLYQMFIQSMSNLKESSNNSFSFDAFKNVIESNYKEFIQLNENNTNKYNELLSQNEKLYQDFNKKIQDINESYENDLKSIEEKFNLNVKEIEQELIDLNKESIQKYKEYENEFISKFQFLTGNKRTNKETYINEIIKINTNRINSNHNYQDSANDSGSINEQKQNSFLHSLEDIEVKYKTEMEEIERKYNQNIKEIDNKILLNQEDYFEKIKQKDRLNADHTIILNNEITKISNEYANRLKYGFVPYDLDNNKILDEQADKINMFNKVEATILTDFKEQLQKNDNDIQNLRSYQKEYQAKHKLSIDEENQIYRKKRDSINRKYRKFFEEHKKNNSNLSEKEKYKIEKKYTLEKQSEQKELQAAHKNKIEELKKDYIENEINFITQIELLRAEKSKYEIIKTTAMKNLNLEKDIYSSIYNAKLQMSNKERENFISMESFDENKTVLLLRLNRDIDNANSAHEIREIERETKKQLSIFEYQKELAKLTKTFEENKLEAEVYYQRELVNNRINLANITNMLNVQKGSISNKYETNVAYLKMDLEKSKATFYNECDNLQYQLYKIQHDLLNKKIDAEMEMRKKITENKHQLLESRVQYEKRISKNLRDFDEYSARVELYNQRFEVEKKIITESFEYFYNATSKITSLENLLLSNFNSFDEMTFSQFRKAFLISLDYLRQIKMELLNNHYDKEVSVINTRINFERDIKYNRIIENITQEKNTHISQLKSRKDKLIETINSYTNTISLFKNNILEYEKRKLNMEKKIKISKKNLSRKKTILDEHEELIRQYISNEESINTLKGQITANLRNIGELSAKLEIIDLEINKIEEQYQKRNQTILNSQEKESKVYVNTISFLTKQYAYLKSKVLLNNIYLTPSKYIYKNSNRLNNKSIINNNKYISDLKTLFETHFNIFISAVSNEIKILDVNHISTYERTKAEIDIALSNEVNSNNIKLNVIEHEYSSHLTVLEHNHDDEKNNIYQQINQVSNKLIDKQRKFNNEIARLKAKLDYDIDCHAANQKEYDEYYFNQNQLQKNIYNAKIIKAKNQYKNGIKLLENKFNSILKNSNSREAHNHAFKKQKIIDLNSEYKANLNKTNQRIKTIIIKEKKDRKNLANYLKTLNKSYLESQKTNRNDSEIALKDIKERANLRIKTLIKEYKKKNIK